MHLYLLTYCVTSFISYIPYIECHFTHVLAYLFHDANDIILLLTYIYAVSYYLLTYFVTSPAYLLFIMWRLLYRKFVFRPSSHSVTFFTHIFAYLFRDAIGICFYSRYQCRELFAYLFCDFWQLLDFVTSSPHTAPFPLHPLNGTSYWWLHSCTVSVLGPQLCCSTNWHNCNVARFIKVNRGWGLKDLLLLYPLWMHHSWTSNITLK